MCYKRPGPRCSNHAYAVLQSALKQGDQDKIVEAQKDYASTPAGMQTLREQGRDDLADKGLKRREAQMQAYTATMEEEELRQEMNDRMTSEELDELITHRDDTRAALNTAEDELKQMKDDKAEFTDLREKKFEVREAYMEHVQADSELEAYKDETAYIVSQLNSETDEGKQYTGDTLGNLEKIETHPELSRAWHKQRQEGFGGSDIGKIVGTGDKAYRYSNYQQVLESKVTDYDAMSDEEFNVGEEDEVPRGAQDRGHVWEPVIANIFDKNHPELDVSYTKATWRSSDNPDQVVNVDGLLSSREDEEPDGFLEIKTSSKPDDWEDGIPDNYRAQALWYMDAADFDYCYFGVQIDDREYREYKITKGEVINDDLGTIQDVMPKINDMKEKVAAKRRGEEIGRKRPVHPEIKPSRAQTSPEKVLASYAGISPQDASARLTKRTEAGEDYKSAVYSELQQMSADDTQDRVFIDLETTGFSDTKNEIIEIGWSRRNQHNEVVDEGQMLFSPDDRFLASRGTGAVETHNIHPHDVADKPSFRDSEVQDKMREVFDGNTTIVAHNAPFEKRFLEQNVDGFREQEHRFLDTMHLNQLFERETSDNSLESFVKANDVPYENAHRALVDTNMTADAFHIFRNKHKT